MGKILEIQLEAERNVQSGETISLFSLFVGGELGKATEVLEDVTTGTDIVCKVIGLDELRCKAGITKSKGEVVHISEFFKLTDLYKQMVSPKGLRKGDGLPIVIETA